MILVFLIFIIPKYHIHNPPYFRKRTLKFLLNSIWTCSVEGDTILHDGGLQTKKLDQSPINVTASYYFVADYIHDYVLGCLLLLKSVSNAWTPGSTTRVHYLLQFWWSRRYVVLEQGGVTKGQLISKCPFVVFKSTKNTKEIFVRISALADSNQENKGWFYLH